jgi:hypothetical protein
MLQKLGMSCQTTSGKKHTKHFKKAYKNIDVSKQKAWI